MVMVSGSLFVSGESRAQQISLAQEAAGLNFPTHITHAGDGSGRLFVVEQDGRIRIVKNGLLLPTPFLDITDRVLSGGEQGLLSLAFPPGFAAKGYFYVNYTRNLNLDGATVVSRFFITADPDIAAPATEQVILTIPQPVSNNNGGQLAFGPDGFLYIGVGDGGGFRDSFNNAQNLGVLLGKILRIDVEAGIPPAPAYVIPPGNPFIGVPGAAPEIWALGLRNPFHFSFDRGTNDLYIADVGEFTREEINFQPPGIGGRNYGWNILEGSECVITGCTPPVGSVLPVFEYGRLQGDCAVIGGHVYRGSFHPRLQGIYFYGDFCSGRIWGLQNAGVAPQNTLLLDTFLSISTFGEDEGGEVYVASLSGGVLSRIGTFADVTSQHFAIRQIEAVFTAGITGGCSTDPFLFCPDAPITRSQMAVFIETSLGAATPPTCTGAVFSDVNATTAGEAFCGFIEDLAARGITGGCTPTRFCPNDPVSRGQMAVFIEAALGNPPNPCAGQFADVPDTHPFCGFIERLASDGVTGGCGGGNYCPNDPATRGQMAVFLVAAPNPLLP